MYPRRNEDSRNPGKFLKFTVVMMVLIIVSLLLFDLFITIIIEIIAYAILGRNIEITVLGRRVRLVRLYYTTSTEYYLATLIGGMYFMLTAVLWIIIRMVAG